MGDTKGKEAANFLIRLARDLLNGSVLLDNVKEEKKRRLAAEKAADKSKTVTASEAQGHRRSSGKCSGIHLRDRRLVGSRSK